MGMGLHNGTNEWMDGWMLGGQAIRSGYMDSEYRILLGHRGVQVGILVGIPVVCV